MKNKLIVSLAALIFLSYSGLSLASTYSPMVTNGNKTWLQPTLTADADTIDGGGWIWATNDDLYTLFNSYFGSGESTYTGEKNYDGSGEGYGSYYFKFGVRLGFFNDFKAQYQRPDYYNEEETAYYLSARTTNTIGAIEISHIYEFVTMSDYGNGDSTNLKWLYKVNAVPVPAAAFMFAPVLLGFLCLRRKAKNTLA